MTRAGSNQLLQKAKKLKSDEFYTQLSDIESELSNYKDCFNNKTVYCNCDDPKRSNFFMYFVKNFRQLGLKKVIASCYIENEYDLFSEKSSFNHGYYCSYSGEEFDEDFIDNNILHFKGDGDFRSLECVVILKEADIIVTNPPFSLFRNFISQVIKYNKEFLVIGNINAITYKEIFSLIQDNKIWLGVNLGRGISGFIVPEHYELYGTEISKNKIRQTIISTNNCLWLTNLELKQRHNKLELTQKYVGNEEKFKKYDNCDGINVNKTQDIPYDYKGLIGVPITFLHKYNPEQFEIVRFRKGDDGKDLRIEGKCPYFRILIKNKNVSI